MNNTKFHCSLNDTTELRNLILEKPDLPLLLFCGEEAWQGDHSFNQADVNAVAVEELTLYGDTWLDKEDYTDKLTDDLDTEEYKHMTDKEYNEMVDRKVAETEFVEAIVVWIG